MNFQLITESPSWLILVCLFAGFIYSWLLYRKDRSFDDTPKWLIYVMAVLRFGVVSILAILLLSPLIKTVFNEVEKPVVVIIQDNTESIIRIRDSVNFKQNYPGQMAAFTSDLSDQFDIRYFSFGDRVNDQLEMTFKGKESDVSSVINEVKARYSGRNLGAVILATDGIYNKGSNPLYTYATLKVPVYTIGLGDTTVLKDVLISKVKHNKTVFVGNTFPVEVTIDARKCGGESTNLEVIRNGMVLATRQVQLSTNRFNTVIPIFLEADKKGMNHYTVKLSGLENEINYDNNTRDFFVDVTESKIKILLLANAPHPDLSAIKNSIDQIPNYEIVSKLINDFDGNLTGYNLAILHQLPSGNRPISNITDELLKREIPVFYILGSQTGINAFNKLQSGIIITGSNNTTGEVLPLPAKDFALFTLNEEIEKKIASFPPLSSPFGNYESNTSINTFINQKIGSVNTEMPLMMFRVDGNKKSAVLAGEGIWKWRLHEYSEFGNSEAVDAVIIKTIQYLSTREKNSPLRLIYKNSYEENEPVIFDAEVRNQSGELINTSDVTISLINEDGVSFPYSFSRTEKAYLLDAGYLPVGAYRFSATTTIGSTKYTEVGNFVVNALQAERTETIADHQLLQALSDKTGGKFYSAGMLSSLSKELNERNDIKPVSYSQKKLSDVINLKWIFILIMFLLSAEWFIRKRNGSY